ncbi:MAG TPA: polysaccharide biosynthesis C-terminal domain-containing protein [Candidatus Lokiarchaeia archaeon]|nr:polysaccharide biosynthesis C-terminal domain-containing protein [Candidatus Lokiarchaeia archaeon]
MTTDHESRTDIFKEPGGSRVIASGMYSLIFSVISSIYFWVFIIVGSGSDGLAYFGLSGSVLGLVGIVSAGFSQAYIAQVKEEMVRNPARALEVASTYARFLFFYGILAGLGCFLASLFIPDTDPLFKYSLLFGAPQVFLNICLGSILTWSIQVVNRYDITSFLGAIGGILTTTIAILAVFLQWPLPYFALAGTIAAFAIFPFQLYYFHRYSPFRLRALLRTAKLSENWEQTRQILRFGILTTFSNMESFQLVSNVNYFLTSLSLEIISPDLALKGTSILTILNIYTQIKVALNYFGSPLNNELAEAYAKDEREKMSNIVNHSVRFSFIVGLGLICGFIGISPIILRYLNGASFLTSTGTFDETLFQLAVSIAIIMSIGQAGFGIATLFANALIGTEKPEVSAKVYLFALVVSAVLTPFCIITLNLGLLGIAVSTLIVGPITMVLMVLEVKRHLQVKFNIRVLNMVPQFLVMSLVLYFFPFGHVTGIIFVDIALAMGIVVFLYVEGLAFFGVFCDEEDWHVIHDLYLSVGLRSIAGGLVRMAKFTYKLNPFHRRQPACPIPEPETPAPQE